MHLIWQVRSKILFPFRCSEDTLWGNVQIETYLESIKAFGCSAFVHAEKNFWGKIDRTSQKGILLISSDNCKAYLVGIQIENGIFKVRKSRKITFNENQMFIEVK